MLLDEPTIMAPSDIAAALGAVTGAVAAGELSPEEGEAVAAILEEQWRAVGTHALKSPLAALEQTQRRALMTEFYPPTVDAGASQASSWCRIATTPHRS